MADNEILATARDAKARERAAANTKEAERARRWQLGRISLGVGIGSAAIAAAVLYARSGADE